jgi:LysR family hydrogen peroxide-inducible transcriptional activator
MSHKITIKQLEYLKAVAASGSFSAAAQICNVTQSTLSGGIATLEAQIGHILIDRSQRKACLTPIGKAIFEKAAQILDLAHDISDLASQSSVPLSGPLRIGIIPTIAPFLLPSLIKPLCDAFPELSLHVHEGQSAEIVDMCVQGDLDVILLALPFKMDGLDHTSLFHEDFYLAASSAWQTEMKTATLKDLERAPLLLLEDGHCLRDHALAACRLQNQKSRTEFNATSLPTLMQFVSQNYGITLLPQMCVEHGAMPPHMRTIPFQSPAPQREIGLAWRKNHLRRDEFDLLAAHIRTIINKKS